MTLIIGLPLRIGKTVRERLVNPGTSGEFRTEFYDRIGQVARCRGPTSLNRSPAFIYKLVTLSACMGLVVL